MTDTAGPHFILSGQRNGTSPDNQGRDSRYWSSLAYTSATLAYILGFYGTNSAVGPANGSYKSVGFSLRCLAQKSSTHSYKRRNNYLKILPSPLATPPENSNHSTPNIQPMIKCVSIQWGWCWVGVILGVMAPQGFKKHMVVTGLF